LIQLYKNNPLFENRQTRLQFLGITTRPESIFSNELRERGPVQKIELLFKTNQKYLSL